jgi:hypothetical protein
LRKLESSRAAVSKEYEFTEQRDTVAKYELSEMKKSHEELVQSIIEMRKENGNAVTPVLDKLKQDVRLCIVIIVYDIISSLIACNLFFWTDS